MDFVSIFHGMFVFLWFIIGLKLLIKAWGWIPILRLTFLGIARFRPDLGLWTPYLLQKYFNEIQEPPDSF